MLDMLLRVIESRQKQMDFKMLWKVFMVQNERMVQGRDFLTVGAVI